ncbi:hypothetical protein PanWU01x14_116620 [Parasponia andersonii]|uniref:Uncharacterized protein n=1 Tax=Parasponia andersonii TaxID=3476 RepID=A0A2P5CWS9_PARAD|nr:hypothetical protein PanWU01x14_116620 [Parasponia andersonii]
MYSVVLGKGVEVAERGRAGRLEGGESGSEYLATSQRVTWQTTFLSSPKPRGQSWEVAPSSAKVKVGQEAAKSEGSMGMGEHFNGYDRCIPLSGLESGSKDKPSTLTRDLILLEENKKAQLTEEIRVEIVKPINIFFPEAVF